MDEKVVLRIASSNQKSCKYPLAYYVQASLVMLVSMIKKVSKSAHNGLFLRGRKKILQFLEKRKQYV